MAKHYCIIAVYLMLLCGCKDNQSKNDHLALSLESTLNADNYFLFRINKDLFKQMKNKYNLDSAKYAAEYTAAIKLNELNSTVDNLFRNIRAELLSALNGYTSLEIGDTLNLKDVDYKDKKITKLYLDRSFKNQQEKIHQLQTELNSLMPNAQSCVYEPIERLWTKRDYNAEEFIVHTTITGNLLFKQINCLYEKLQMN